MSEHFEADFSEIDFVPRYNLAPQQFAPVLRRVDGQRRVDLLRWGLMPAWARDPALASRLINARSETAAAKPAFRAAFKRRRCLVPVDGFYEWKRSPQGKQPYLFSLRNELPMALAGLWEEGTAEGAGSFTILTTAANELLAEVHERMPVILPPETWGLWLNPERTPVQLQPLMRSLRASEMVSRPVDRRVGNVRNDDSALLESSAPSSLL